jgi:hypothetical protein
MYCGMLIRDPAVEIFIYELEKSKALKSLSALDGFRINDQLHYGENSNTSAR